VQSRREGKRTFYKLNPQTDGTAGEFIQLAIRGAKELPEHGGDQINLKRVVNRRRETGAGLFQPGSPAASTASTGRAVPGKRSGICCCAFCRR